MLGEHSPCDALMPSRVVDYIVKQESEEKVQNGYKELLPLLSNNYSTQTTRRLPLTVPSTLSKNLPMIQQRLQSWLSYIKATILDFRGFGSEEIKATGLSPDFFGQLCIMLTFYKIEKFIPVIYETASSRKFLHGRTETIRVMSTEAARVLKLYEKGDKTHMALAIREFAKQHADYTKMASTGLGIDRHFLGLRVMLAELNASTGKTIEPSLFSEKDPCFWKSMTHDLSTSNMSPGTSFYGLGFGPTKPTGYGVNYCVSSGRILASISAWENIHQLQPMTQCPRFDAQGNFLVESKAPSLQCPVKHEASRAVNFRHVLEQTIWEIQQNYFPLLQADKPAKSKL